MKKFMTVAASTLATLAVLPACSATGDDDGGGQTIGVLLLNGDTYFTNVATGIEDANKGDTIVTNYDGDAGKEAEAVDNMISRGVDAIVTSPLDGEASAAALERAASEGVEVVCYNTCVEDAEDSDTVSAFVLSDQAGMGEQTGEYAAKYLQKNVNGPVTFGVLHCDSFDICKQRRDAFFATLDDAGINYSIAAENEELVVDKAVPAAEDMLTSNPQINALWGANDGATAGLVRAVESGPGAGKTPVFGSDMTPVLAKYLKATPPTLLTTTGQDGIATGEKAVEVVTTLADDGSVDPFTQEVPVVNFSVDDLPAVDAYLNAN